VSIESMRDISYGTWTDYRDTIVGSDQRVGAGDGSEAVRFLVHCKSILEDRVSMLLEG
jgi:hypothetical protein